MRIKIHPDINQVTLKREQLREDEFDEVCGVERNESNSRPKDAQQPLPDFVGRREDRERVRVPRNAENAEERKPKRREKPF